MMRILLVDDHVLFRQGLVSLLNDYPDLKVVGQADSAREAIAKANDLNPDLILMDVSLPDGTGLEAMKTILTRRSEIKFIMLAVDESDDLLFNAVRLGAKGYILKSTSISNLVAALHSVEHNEAFLTREMMSRIVDEFSRLGSLIHFDEAGITKLTCREREILELLGEDLSNQEIAKQLNITENTAKVHVHNILEKLQFRNRREAGKFARRNGISASNLFP